MPQTANENSEDDKALPTEDDLESDAQKQSTVLKKFLPVSSLEVSRVLGGCIIIAITCYIYSICKATKKGVIADRLDTSATNYIKSLIVLPVNTFLVTIMQKKLSKLTPSQLMDKMLFYFGLFFVAYGFGFRFLRKYCPFDEFWTIDLFADSKFEFIGLAWMLPIFCLINSPFDVLYGLAAELWGSLIFSYLFWAFANEFLTKKQSLRILPIFKVASNIGLLISGIQIWIVTSYMESCSYERKMFIQHAQIVFCGVMVIFLLIVKHFFEKRILVNKLILNSGEVGRKKSKVSLSAALSLIVTSKFFASMSFCVFIYNISLQIIEQFCDFSTQKFKPDDVKSYVESWEGINQISTSLFSTIFCLFVPYSRLINNGYFIFYAISTTIFSFLGVAAVISTAYYNLNLDQFSPRYERRRYLEVCFGQFFRGCLLVSKYAAFDLMKEAISMRVNITYRAIFKGVYDAQMGKVGKGLGGCISIVFSNIYNNSDVRVASLPLLFILLPLNVIWVLPVLYLTKIFNDSVRNNSDLDLGWTGSCPAF